MEQLELIALYILAPSLLILIGVLLKRRWPILEVRDFIFNLSVSFQKVIEKKKTFRLYRKLTGGQWVLFSNDTWYKCYWHSATRTETTGHLQTPTSMSPIHKYDNSIKCLEDYDAKKVYDNRSND